MGIVAALSWNILYDYIETGNRLLMARVRKNIKQREMGKLLGLSQSAYSQLETGRKNIEQLFIIADALEVPVEWILGLRDNEDFLSLNN